MIPNPVEIGDTLVWSGEREKRIVAVGRLEPQKNHSLLLQAFARFRAQYPAYTLELYGQGSLEAALRGQADRSPPAGYTFGNHRRDNPWQ